MKRSTGWILVYGVLSLLSMGGCHMMEGLSYDIEDASAYAGQHLAEGGEDLADWVRELGE